MLHHFDYLCNQLLRYVNHLSPQGWLILLAVIVLLGLVCLRGFGSRTYY